MSVIQRLRGLRKGELGGLAGDSAYVAVWQGANGVADLAQIALISRALGVEEFGRFAIIVSLVLLVDRFFDVRVGVAATTFGAQALEGEPRRAVGVFQLSYLIDAATGLLAFVVVAALALPLGPQLAGEGSEWIALVYATSLLVGTLDDSSLAVLRLLDRYRLLAGYTVVIELLRVALIAVAVLVFESLVAVAAALVIQRLILTGAGLFVAARSIRAATGEPLFGRRRLDLVRDLRRPVLRTVMATNFVSYGRLTQTQLPTLLLGALSGPLQAGLYKIGMAVGAGIGKFADPPYIALLPRMSRFFAAGDRARAGRLVRESSRISVPLMLALFGLVVLLASPILALVGGDDASGATGALVAGSAAYALNAALFWNMAVVYAGDRATSAAKVAIGVAVAQAALLVPAILAFEATGAALTFLITTAGSNLWMTGMAMRLLRARSAEAER